MTIAGLCHDIGHGPFSHMFEKNLLPRVGLHDWSHETIASKIIEYMETEYGCFGGSAENNDGDNSNSNSNISKNDLELIIKLI